MSLEIQIIREKDSNPFRGGRKTEWFRDHVGAEAEVVAFNNYDAVSAQLSSAAAATDPTERFHSFTASKYVVNQSLFGSETSTDCF